MTVKYGINCARPKPCETSFRFEAAIYFVVQSQQNLQRSNTTATHKKTSKYDGAGKVGLGREGEAQTMAVEHSGKRWLCRSVHGTKNGLLKLYIVSSWVVVSLHLSSLSEASLSSGSRKRLKTLPTSGMTLSAVQGVPSMAPM
eukprot:3888027-Amphidinium_carterae.2